MGLVSVRDFGAKGDGKQDDTAAIQQAINATRPSHGGEVVIPAGRYRVSTLFLCDHLQLTLQAGAILDASTTLSDYLHDGRHLGLIYAEHLTDITLQGPGRIELNGIQWMTSDMPPVEKPEGPIPPKPRPAQALIFADCTDVTLKDLTIVDAPHWTVSLIDCEQVHISNITIKNNPLIPNNDGINLSCCRNTTVQGCHVVAGDDAIIVNGFNDHQDFPGFVSGKRGSHHVAITNCILSARSAAVRIGAGQNDIRNCTISNCVITDSNRGLLIWQRDGNVIEHIHFANIIVHTRMFDGSWWGKGEAIAVSSIARDPGDKPGHITDISFTNIHGSCENGILLYGTQASPIQRVRLNDVDLAIKPSPFVSKHPKLVDLRPTSCVPEGYTDEQGAAIMASHVQGLDLIHTQVKCPEENASAIDATPWFVGCTDVRRCDL